MSVNKLGETSIPSSLMPSLESPSTGEAKVDLTESTLEEKKSAEFWKKPLVKPPLYNLFHEKSWKIGVLAKLETFAAPSLLSKGVEEHLNEFMETQGVDSTPIMNLLSEAQQVTYRERFEAFKHIHSPERFLSAIPILLTKEEIPIFHAIIGGKDALNFLSKLNTHGNRKFLLKFLIQFQNEKRTDYLARSNLVKFDSGFDDKHPIASIPPSEIISSFRAFFGEDSIEQQAFVVNTQPLSITIKDPQNKQLSFLSGLIEGLQKEIKIESDLMPVEQADLLIESTNTLQLQQVPVLRILQAMTFNAFSFGALHFQTHSFPKLFHSENNIPMLRYDSGKVVRFEIKLDAQKKTFTVRQIRPYHFLMQFENSFVSRELGSINVFWEISGSLLSPEFRANLHSGDLRLLEDAPYENRVQIIGMMGLVPLKQ